MRVVSFVPSWTETLIECGVNVVGCTQFCIHPEPMVRPLSRVGGTKQLHLKKLEKLNPDIVIFDKEENNKDMADSCPFPWVATHVEGVEDVPRELKKLSEVLNNQKLRELSDQYLDVITKLQSKNIKAHQLPFLYPLSEEQNLQLEQYKWVYLIWRKPFMTVSHKTFIGSIFKLLGFENQLMDFEGKYPEISLGLLESSKEKVFLCSSEPYPFEKHISEVKSELKAPCLLIDGEPLSWFGVRSYRYLARLAQ